MDPTMYDEHGRARWTSERSYDKPNLGPADTVLHADNYGHGPAYSDGRCDHCRAIADRAAEARHGGRYITGALSRAIENDGIRARFAGEDGPEKLAEIWRYTASPSGSAYGQSGRDTTARYAQSAAAIGGVEWAHSAYWRPPMLPESALSWPVYRAAMVADVYGALWGQASEAEERVLDTLARCAGLSPVRHHVGIPPSLRPSDD